MSAVPHLILTAVEPDLAEAFHAHLGDLPFVTIHTGSIFDTVADALVSPANSFGFMDGGPPHPSTPSTPTASATSCKTASNNSSAPATTANSSSAQQRSSKP